MGCAPAPATEAIAAAMTCCECAEVAFDEVARRVEAEKVSVEEAARRTGCGRTCEACIPDLHRFLARRGAAY
jgi:NAD(P)H-nitrite reductase large subunit